MCIDSVYAEMLKKHIYLVLPLISSFINLLLKGLLQILRMVLLLLLLLLLSQQQKQDIQTHNLLLKPLFV